MRFWMCRVIAWIIPFKDCAKDFAELTAVVLAEDADLIDLAAHCRSSSRLDDTGQHAEANDAPHAEAPRAGAIDTTTALCGS